MHSRDRPADERLAAEPAAATAAPPAVQARQLFSAMGNAAAARMLQRAPDDDAGAGAAAVERLRKDLLDNVTNRVVEARLAFEATPPNYSKAFIAASQADGELDRIRRGSAQLPPEMLVALGTRGMHIAVVHLEALDYNGGDLPAGARAGINQTLHDLSPITGPEAEKRLLGKAADGDGAPADPAVERVRKALLDEVTNRMVEAKVHLEATPPDYSKAFILVSQADAALDRIRDGSSVLPGEMQYALSTRGPHIAAVHLEAMDYSGGDLPMGVRSGLNQVMHDLSPITGPEAEKRLLQGPTAAPDAKPVLAPNPFD